ncbi:Inner membrane transport permease YbhR [Aquisphaera giovannonii]|uniref:Inner membrane transport permease YbhR n=1 Tax=Aquisphaera giovannonii TaxID=406548 RepID=A0A5B9VWI4_9BACT|nr:ABC transporter permease [Aquisphaera giovannonii]QEH32307.1 Inner membrane transport permease YbhR [Aquisphaera giovannonii]
MLGRVRCLIVKEFLAVWRDKKSRIILIVPPLIQMTVFTFAATQEVKDVPVAVYDQDPGTSGRDLLMLFEGSPNFSKVIRVRSDAEAARALGDQDAVMVVRVGQDFSRELAAGRPGKVQLLLDGRRSNASRVLSGYAAEIVARYDARLAAARRGPPPASTVVARAWFNPNLEAKWSTVPALVAILSTLMGLMITGMSVARERELGTFDQVLVSPLSPTEILIGKSIPAMVIGLGEATGMILVGVLVFGVPFRGSIPLLYVSIAVYLSALIGVGLLVSSVARTQQQAILYSFMFMVPAMLLSGFATPVENMPDWLQAVTLANPVRHFLGILKGLFLKDLPAAEVARRLVPLLIIAACTLTSASWLFRRRLE